MKLFVIVTDLGLCKIFRLQWSPRGTPHLEMMEEFSLADAHGKLLNKVTDQAGRFRVPSSRMAMSYAERQKLPAELKRRLIKQIAENIHQFFKDEQADSLCLAADKEILHPLVSQLNKELQSMISQTVALDLTKAPKENILEHLLIPNPTR